MQKEDNALTLQTMYDLMEGRLYPYSGRSMYGRQCASVHFDTKREFQEFTTVLIEELMHKGQAPRKALQVVREVSEDSLGLGMVFYWEFLSYNSEMKDAMEQNS